MTKTCIESNFEQLFEKYYERLCLFLNLYTKDMAVIEDVIQDVFCKLWVNRDFIEVRYLRSYLYASTRNGVINHIKEKKLHTSLLTTWMEEESKRQRAADCIDREEFQRQIDAAIESLPPKCKHVFMLSRYQNLTNKEISQQEKISEKMVEKHLSTAIKKIRSLVMSPHY